MDIARQFLAIALVLGLLSMALWFLRKKGWSALKPSKLGQNVLESRGKLALSARHSIHLIRIGDRSLILALHPDGVTFLGDATCADDCRRKEAAAK